MKFKVGSSTTRGELTPKDMASRLPAETPSNCSTARSRDNPLHLTNSKPRLKNLYHKEHTSFSSRTSGTDKKNLGEGITARCPTQGERLNVGSSFNSFRNKVVNLYKPFDTKKTKTFYGNYGFQHIKNQATDQSRLSETNIFKKVASQAQITKYPTRITVSDKAAKTPAELRKEIKSSKVSTPCASVCSQTKKPVIISQDQKDGLRIKWAVEKNSSCENLKKVQQLDCILISKGDIKSITLDQKIQSLASGKIQPPKNNLTLKDLTPITMIHHCNSVNNAKAKKQDMLTQKLKNNNYLYVESQKTLSKLFIPSKNEVALASNVLSGGILEEQEETISPKIQTNSKRTGKFTQFVIEAQKSVSAKLRINLNKDSKTYLTPSKKTPMEHGNAILKTDRLITRVKELLPDQTGYFKKTEIQYLEYWNQAVVDFRKAHTLYKLTGKFAKSGKKAKLGRMREGVYYTIFFDLDETLAHCSNAKKTSPTLKSMTRLKQAGDSNKDSYVDLYIRPFVDSVLKSLRKKFEIVLFTSASKTYADNIIDQIDPNNCLFDGRLYRENCLDIGGGILIKDLSIVQDRCLNRVLLVDNCMYSAYRNITNFVPILPFTGSEGDEELIKLRDFLDQLSGHRTDIRKWLGNTFNTKKIYA